MKTVVQLQIHMNKELIYVEFQTFYLYLLHYGRIVHSNLLCSVR